MDDAQAAQLKKMLKEPKPVVVLNIPDNFEYRDPDLIEEIKKAYDFEMNKRAPDSNCFPTSD